MNCSFSTLIPDSLSQLQIQSKTFTGSGISNVKILYVAFECKRILIVLFKAEVKTN